MNAELAKQLDELASCVRDPSRAGAPHWPLERLNVYRELVFNANAGLLSNGFPILSASLGETGWNALVRNFLQSHSARTPLFTEVGGEFVAWLDAHGDATLPAWAAQLAHWEWLEIEALLAADAEQSTRTGEGLREVLLDEVPLLHPSVRVAAYDWPLHRFHTEGGIPDPAPTCLMVRRDWDGRVHFTDLSPLLMRLLELLDEGRTGRDALQQLSIETEPTDCAQFYRDAESTLLQLATQGVICGSRAQGAR